MIHYGELNTVGFRTELALIFNKNILLLNHPLKAVGFR